MFLKLIIFAAILACVAPFFLKGPDGQPLMTLDDWLPADASDMATGRSGGPPEKVTVYKWQDENGVWQFSNDPADAGAADTLELDGNINIIPSVPVGTASAAVAPVSPSVGALPPGMTSVSPERVQAMMDTVNNLQETVDQRKADLDRAVRPQ
ncbi:MAG: DUF4124 domain-containing protein [Pseudomonadota bacterium]